MKNLLNYFYHIIISEDKINNGYFSYQNHLFLLYKYQRKIDEVDKLLELNKEMIQKNIKINKIINNIYNQTLTLHDGNYYVLLLINYQYNSNNYQNLMINNPKYDILKRNNWDYLWSMKIDYIEYQIKHFNNKYPIIQGSIHYYIGLSENAIKYYKMINKNNVSLYVSHRRFNIDNFYNPVELIIDYKARDIGEYIKYCFFHNKKDIYEIKKYLRNINLNNIDYLLLYTRMLYPSFYFDIYDNIINNNYMEDSLQNIIDKSNNYEELLNEIYLLIKRKTNIISIAWINEKGINNL